MSTEIATLQPAEFGRPLSSKELTARLAVIQDVLKNVMQRTVDYGVIPGTDKPTLLKPGAEKICVTFRLSADTPDIDEIPDMTGGIRYRVRVPIRAADGAIVAVGIGECSTGEEKYRWRRPVHPREFDATPEDRKREKWTRKGDVWKQVRVEPADVANTVLKMAHKRAYVHGVIMATAAGSIFTQDAEDRPEGMDEPSEHETVRRPQSRQQAGASQAAHADDTGVISDAQRKRLFAIAHEHAWSDAELKEWLRIEGIESSSAITRASYDDIIEALKLGPEAAMRAQVPL